MASRPYVDALHVNIIGNLESIFFRILSDVISLFICLNYLAQLLLKLNFTFIFKKLVSGAWMVNKFGMNFL